MEKLIITAAITGGELVSRRQTPYLPCTVDEIVDEVVRVRRAGASIVHLHPKEPNIGLPHPDPNPVLRKYIERIRESEASDIIIEVSSVGGRTTRGAPEKLGIDSETAEAFCGWATPVDPYIGGLEGTDELVQERMKLGADMSSLNMGSINIWTDRKNPRLRGLVFLNPLSYIERLARWIYDNGMVPKVEVYDAGQIETAKLLVSEGKLREPVFITFLLVGGLSAMPPTPEALLYCTRTVPNNWVWFASGPRAEQMSLLTMAVAMGGHVRIGMEDNRYLERGVLARSNEELVAKAVRIAKEIGRSIATPDEVREMGGIKKCSGR